MGSTLGSNRFLANGLKSTHSRNNRKGLLFALSAQSRVSTPPPSSTSRPSYTTRRRRSETHCPNVMMTAASSEEFQARSCSALRRPSQYESQKVVGLDGGNMPMPIAPSVGQPQHAHHTVPA